MITTIFLTPQEMALEIAKQAQEKRLSLNLSQKTLSDRAGVSLGVIKKFEQSGKISLESLLKLALILESFPAFKQLFASTSAELPSTLDALLKETTRKRGRK